MPDAAAKATAAASGKKPPPADRVGEELADDASIWPLFDKLAREDDERRTKTWDNGLNNLALFAGLFSAVTTAFIIEAQQDLEPDYAQLIFLVLNASASGEKFAQQPFVVSHGARAVNCLWVASLILSLSAALIAIMGKDWIGMYTARPVCNLRQWAEMRTYRLLCVERWYMSGVIAAAPVLLHISLLFFGAGLVCFISSDPVTHHLTLGLALAAGVLYLVTTLSAVLFSGSPFKSPATQMIRATLSACYSYGYSIIRRKRNPVRTLVCEIHSMILRQVDGTALLPGGTSENRHWYTGLWSAIVTTRDTAVAYMRKIPTWVCTVHSNLKGSSVHSRLHSISSSARSLSYDWFLSSMWTDLPTDRRPNLLAEAMSWLSGASQAPDVFRAVVFALGDLDVGPQVGKHTSSALRTRLRAEIRRTWNQVDFLTFSRYVIADQNTPGIPVLDWFQFACRSVLYDNAALCCEDGLAAFIMIYPDILPGSLVQYFPDQVAQPRMHEFLLPYMQKTQQFQTDLLIILANRYRKHCLMTDSFTLSSLETCLYQTLDTKSRKAYASAVTVKYGGTAGAIELLTFLCCHNVIDDIAKAAAVELVMYLLERLPEHEHQCLAYLFGSRGLWDATWKDKHWDYFSLDRLSSSLQVSCAHPFEPTSVRTLSDDWQFNLSLARTAAIMLSPPNNVSRWKPQWIKFLHSHLCQSGPPGFPDKYQKLDVIRLILHSGALLTIVGRPQYFSYDDDCVSLGTAIQAAIIRDMGRCFHDSEAGDRNQLLEELVYNEIKRPGGETCTWDLGEWLRTTAPEILKQWPSYTSAMRDVCKALSTIYAFCEHNPELRTSWDRIGYSGPPEEIIYLCDPYLDIGEFFACRGRALAVGGMICMSSNNPQRTLRR